MAHTEYICTDPSHPPLLYDTRNRSVFREVSETVVHLEQEGLSEEDIVKRVSSDATRRFSTLLSSGDDGFGVQELRRRASQSWKDIFLKIESLGFLVGWFINSCAQERNAHDLHYPLCNLAFESNRTLFAIVNQLRSALANDTFVYLRTLHETLVKSRFLKRHTEDDPDLPGRFIYHTNAAYKKFYERFAEYYGENSAKDMWIETEQHFQDKIHPEAQGDYAWVYPLVEEANGEPKSRPTFRDLRRAVDENSTFSIFYYDVSAEKIHGKFIWNPLMVQPDAREFQFHPFNDENTGLVLDLMLPMYEEVIENTGSTCLTSSHALVRLVVKAVFEDIRNAVRAAIASNPEWYGHFERLSLPGDSSDSGLDKAAQPRVD